MSAAAASIFILPGKGQSQKITPPILARENDDYRANQWVPSTNVVVSNNTVYNVQGDGIVVTDGFQQQITNNVVHDTHRDGDFSAGIWSEDSYEATIADNEVYRVLFNGGNQ